MDHLIQMSQVDSLDKHLFHLISCEKNLLPLLFLEVLLKMTSCVGEGVELLFQNSYRCQHRLQHMQHLFAYKAILAYLELPIEHIPIVRHLLLLKFWFRQEKQLCCNDNHMQVRYTKDVQSMYFQFQYPPQD